MMVNGVWMENITCEKCRRRHPAEITCFAAGRLAAEAAAKREADAEDFAEPNPVEELQRQLAEVTKERDQLRAMLNLADALRNRERNSK